MKRVAQLCVVSGVILLFLTSTGLLSIDPGSGDVDVSVNTSHVDRAIVGFVEGAQSSVKSVDEALHLNETRAEKEVFKKVNNRRVASGLWELRWDSEVAEDARIHAEDMAAQGYYNHTSLNGVSVAERYDFCRGGENLFMSDPAPIDADDVAENTVEAWMDSTGHRRNILDGSYNRAGVGVAVSEDDELYVVMGYCR